jgi:polyhydroxybutyrate depolymerase
MNEITGKQILRRGIRLMMVVTLALVAIAPVPSGHAMAQPDCAALRAKLNSLEASRARVQAQLNTAEGAEKQLLLQQLRAVEAEFHQTQSKMNPCDVMNWKIGNDTREAVVLVPRVSAAGHGHPIVFAFHGHGGTMRKMQEQMPIQLNWPAAIVVYPQGLPRTTKKDKDGPGWQKLAGDDGGRDLQFFDAMLATLRQKFNVDNDRIYVTGFSNGGAFSFLLWDERAEVIAALSECAGINHEHPVMPRPLLAIVGRRDEEDPPENQQATIEKAIQANNADLKGELCDPPGGMISGNTCLLHRSSTQTPVKTLFHVGGHEVPFWAAAESVAFFKNFNRSGRIGAHRSNR